MKKLVTKFSEIEKAIKSSKTPVSQDLIDDVNAYHKIYITDMFSNEIEKNVFSIDCKKLDVLGWNGKKLGKCMVSFLEDQNEIKLTLKFLSMVDTQEQPQDYNQKDYIKLINGDFCAYQKICVDS